jgi:type I restriction enzyme S subunit
MTTEHSPLKWERTTLRGCCFRPEYGYTASANQDPVGPKFLRITDIQDGQVDWNTVPYVEKPDDGARSYLLETGDIVIARIGATTGKAFLIQECPEAVFASYLIRIRTKPGLLPRFLNYCFQTSEYWQHIDTQKGGRLKGGVNIPILENLEIPLPPPIEQEAIARALETVQKAKEVRLRELGLERERKATLMEYLFAHGTRGESTKQTEMGEMPESWRVVRLCDACKVKTSFPNFQGLSSLDSSNEADEPVLALKVSDMNRLGNDKYIRRARLSLRVPSARVSTNSFLKPRSVIFPKRGAAIATNKKRLTTTHTVLDPNLIGIESSSSVDSRYLFAFFERFDLRSLQDNTPIPQLNKNDVENVWFLLPSFDEQREIGQVVDACDDKIAALVEETDKLDELFKALLEELMAGRLSAPLIEEHQPQ